MPADLIESLATEIERLWRSNQPSAAGIRQLARKILLDAWDAEAFETPAELPPRTSDRAAILAKSLLAARSIAWMSTVFATRERSSAEELVIAALLCDAGCVRPGRADLPADDPEHPAIAAALAAGLEGVSISLPVRIARHHERFDGTGSPAALAGQRLAIEDRLLAAMIRFAELHETDVLDTAMQLHDEARRGLFDPELTANFVWAVGRRLPVTVGFGGQAPQPWPLTDRGRRRLRLDGPHRELAGPHFGSRVDNHAEAGSSATNPVRRFW